MHFGASKTIFQYAELLPKKFQNKELKVKSID